MPDGLHATTGSELPCPDRLLHDYSHVREGQVPFHARLPV
jgi:hypothetical protein